MITADKDVNPPYVYFVTSHPGPAKQFAVLAEILEKHRVSFGVLAGKSVVKMFVDKRVSCEAFDDDIRPDDLAALVLKVTGKVKVVITDMSERMETVQRKLSSDARETRRVAYYDNPESLVPGGYSETAAKVAPHAQTILFSNSRFESEPVFKSPHEQIPLSDKERFGLGLYLRDEAETIKKLRVEKGMELRRQFFDKLNIKDRGQKIITYIGGANDVYYLKAFPRFLEIILKLYHENNPLLDNTIILIQQHPRAGKEGDQDLKQLDGLEPKGLLVPSMFNTFEGLALADLALYYQTSMAAQLPYAGIPSIQIGHDTFADCLTANGFPYATCSEEFLREACRSLESKEAAVPLESLRKLEGSLGIKKDWEQRWLRFLGKDTSN